jgi:hypothetical protein
MKKAARPQAIGSQQCSATCQFEIEDVNAVPRMLLSGYADVTRGGGMKFERVVFLGPGGKSRAEFHLKKGHVKKLEQFGLASRVDPPTKT